jgi:hypothetical protein
MPKRPRTEANEDAEERYRRKFKQVLIRFTEAEMQVIDEARGESSRPDFLKVHGLKAAQRVGRKP